MRTKAKSRRGDSPVPAIPCRRRRLPSPVPGPILAIDHAIQPLLNGLQIIGDNARLYAALGLAHLQYREAGIDLGEFPLREAEICVRRVFALEPASASGLQLRGWIH